MALPREAAKPHPPPGGIKWILNFRVRTQRPAGSGRGSAEDAPPASVLKELTLCTASVPLHQAQSVPQGVKCPFTYVPLHTPEQAEECLRRP